jgi:eukaryotic-like serine/threonine-protein kinase
MSLALEFVALAGPFCFTCHARIQLGGSLLGLRRCADAEPLLREGYEGLRRRGMDIPRHARAPLPQAAGWLAALYEATGRPDEAAKWRAESSKSP